jgi:type VI secretion system secreted protein VgrG
MEISIPNISSNINLFECAIDGKKLDAYEFSMTERLFGHFILSMTVVSKPRLKIHDYLEKKALLTLRGSKVDRYFHGRIHSFTEAISAGKYNLYHAVVMPDLTYLGNVQDVRIFQDMAAPDIIAEVLKGIGMQSNAYEFRLKSQYAPREYCVQYRETSQSFLRRIMAEEGITHYHEHKKDGHLLVFADSSSSHTPITGPSKILFSQKGQLNIMEECVSDIFKTDRVTSGKVQLTDYDFKHPSNLPESRSKEKEYDNLEIYDFPGRFIDEKTGNRLAKVTLERRTSGRQTLSGSSVCRHFSVGRRFDLISHPNADFNGTYILTEVIHTGLQPQTLQELTGSEGGSTYGNTFTCIPKTVTWRPDLPGSKPSVTGVQTATVTGPKDEEIYTDQYGRIKVQFHWDRQGKNDEKTSCWIRVAQPWAGAGWGHLFIPRIGQEVVVNFIDGDPDRPVVTGAVYNGANMPPYNLPAEKTKSTIKTESTKGGGGFNELRFEDKKDAEEIYIHGQKDWNIEILNDKTQTIGHDEKLDVKNDRTKTVGHDQKEDIGNNKTINVIKVHTETIGEDMTVKVGKNLDESTGENKTEAVEKNFTNTIGEDADIRIGGNETVDITKNDSRKIGENSTLSVGKDFNATVDNDASVSVRQSSTVNTENTMTVTAGKTITVSSSGSDVIVRTGGASVTITGSGDIVLKGGNITLDASGTITMNGKAINQN